MKLGKNIKQPKEIEARYDDDSGVCGKFYYDKNSKEWRYEHKWEDLNEEECLSAHKILKELNKQVRNMKEVSKK